MKMLLKNGRVIDPANKIDDTLDIIIEDGKISEIKPRISEKGIETIDLAGLVVAPGFIDMHVHLREPGREDEETIETGTKAAAAGGFTGVACMPNTEPVNDDQAVTEYILSQAKKSAIVNVYPIGCITKAREGEELAQIGDLVESGVVAVSDDGNCVASGLIMRKALEYTKMFGIPIIDHCEDPNLSDGGVMNEGYYSTILGLKGMPFLAEDVMAIRDILLAEMVKGKLHIAHVSTKGCVNMVREAKKRGAHVTCEVTPHHFTLTDAAVMGYDTNTKMNPPLRSEGDRKAVLEGLKDGTIDCIATDHAPHNSIEKNVEFSQAPFGIIGLETAVSLALDRLVHTRIINLSRLVELMSLNPARILNIKKGILSKGEDADITILDIKKTVTVDVKKLKSKSRNTPFNGLKLKGAPVMTIVSGKIVHDSR
ncbi:MAG: dihydroorotase [Acidobacteriota bacterium]